MVRNWRIDKTYRYISRQRNDPLLSFDNTFYTLIDLEFEYIGEPSNIANAFFDIIGVIFFQSQYNILFAMIELSMGRELLVPRTMFVNNTVFSKDTYANFSYISSDSCNNSIEISFSNGCKGYLDSDNHFRCDYGKKDDDREHVGVAGVVVYIMRDTRRVDILYADDDGEEARRLSLESRLIFEKYQDIVDYPSDLLAFASGDGIYYIIPRHFSFHCLLIRHTPYVLVTDARKVMTKNTLYNEDSAYHLGYTLTAATTANGVARYGRYCSITGKHMHISSSARGVVRVEYHSDMREFIVTGPVAFVSTYDEVILHETFDFHARPAMLLPTPTYLPNLAMQISFSDILYLYRDCFLPLVGNAYISHMYLVRIDHAVISQILSRNRSSTLFDVGRWEGELVDAIVCQDEDACPSQYACALRPNGKIICIGFMLADAEDAGMEETYRDDAYAIYEREYFFSR
jgi:hypothetical protein